MSTTCDTVAGNIIVEGFKDGNDQHIDHLLHKVLELASFFRRSIKKKKNFYHKLNYAYGFKSLQCFVFEGYQREYKEAGLDARYNNA